MKSELTIKLEATQIEADKTVREAQQYVGARSLRIAAMSTSHLIGEALTLSKSVDDKPATEPPK